MTGSTTHDEKTANFGINSTHFRIYFCTAFLHLNRDSSPFALLCNLLSKSFCFLFFLQRHETARRGHMTEENDQAGTHHQIEHVHVVSHLPGMPVPSSPFSPSPALQPSALLFPPSVGSSPLLVLAFLPPESLLSCEIHRLACGPPQCVCASVLAPVPWKGGHHHQKEMTTVNSHVPMVQVSKWTGR